MDARTEKIQAPRMGALDPFEKIRAELIQVGNRHPGARRDMDNIERMVAKLAERQDDKDAEELLEVERRGWDQGYAAGRDRLPGDKQRFPRP
jgi:hypothetical protein